MSFPEGHKFQTLSFERIILVLEVTCSNDVAYFVALRISGFLDVVLAIDLIIDIHKLPLVHKLLRQELRISG